MSEEMKVTVINHPLVQHKLTLMRQKETGTKDFRELLEEIAMLMTYEITRDFPLKEVEIETPVAKCKSKVLAGKKVGVVPMGTVPPGPGRRIFIGGKFAEGGIAALDLRQKTGAKK